MVNGAWPSSEFFLLARHPDWILLFFWPRFLAEKRRADLDCFHHGPIHVNRLNTFIECSFFLISGKILKNRWIWYFKSDESYHLMLLGFLTICNYSSMHSSIKAKIVDHLLFRYYQFLHVLTCCEPKIVLFWFSEQF